MRYKTIGYHTAEDRGNLAELKRNAPFLSQDQDAFLSYGFYFWDQDLERAHYWGKVHLGGNYVIFECELDLQNMMDLVGSRLNQKEFLELEQLVINHYNLKEKPSMSKVIALLKKLNGVNGGGIFEYDSVRAQTHPWDERKMYNFVCGRKEQMNLNPRIMICLFKKTPVCLPRQKIVHPGKYVEQC